MPDDNEKQKAQEQEIQIKERSPFIWLLVIVLVAGLILTTNKYKEEIQPAKKEIITKQIKEAPAEAKEPTAPEKEKFPLTTWLIIAGGLLLLRAGGEFYLAIKSGKTAIQWITPDMLSIGIGIITVIILVLQAFYPDQWWNNLCQSPLGTPLLFAFGAIILVWYILPGTGDITLKLGKPFCIIVGLGLMIILVFTATGGELKYEDKDGKDRWFWQKRFKESEKFSLVLPLEPASWSDTIPMDEKIDTGLAVKNYGSFLITADKDFYLVQGDGKWGPEHLILVQGPAKNRQMTYSIGGGIWVKAKYPDTKVEIKTL